VEIKEIRHFRRILRRFERLTNAQIKNCCSGVTLAQCLVLLEVEEQDRPTMGQLASQLRLDNSTLSRTVDGLVGNGMVERLRRWADESRPVEEFFSLPGASQPEGRSTALDARRETPPRRQALQ